MRTPKADALTRLILAVFRANGRLLDAGDGLVAGLGLTSSLWQVVGALALSRKPLTVPQIADLMGITRQGTQKQINALMSNRLVIQRPNPNHKRSPWYVLTRKGDTVFATAEDIQAPWANNLASGLTSDETATALKVLDTLIVRLDAVSDGKSP